MILSLSLTHSNDHAQVLRLAPMQQPTSLSQSLSDQLLPPRQSSLSLPTPMILSLSLTHANDHAQVLRLV
eukprot:COSAG01_NODE_73779_length_236_cov_40.248175_1_plen_69_part_10